MTPKKAPVKKAAKKAPAKKAPAKKAPAKKAPAKKAPAKRAPAKRAPAKRAPAGRPTRTSSAARGAGVSVRVRPAKGRPMLSWVGKKAISSVPSLPATPVESFDAGVSGRIDDSSYAGWPTAYPRGGLLLHGDNKEVLGQLLVDGFRSAIRLIYIDPPFDSAADYVRTVTLRGAPISLSGEGYELGEQIQYSDIWSNDNYLQFMYERLLLLKELLMDSGSILLHCDWHKSHYLRCLMDEVFGADNMQNEIIWQRTDPHNDAKSRLGRVHDTIYWYSKGPKPLYNWESVVDELSAAALKEYNLIRLDSGEVLPYFSEQQEKGRRFKLDDCTWKGVNPAQKFEWRGVRPSGKRVWPYDREGMDAAVENGEFYLRDPAKGAARCRVSYLDDREGQVLQSIWTACGRMKGGVEYPTEKPEALLSRIVLAFSNPGDIVLDSFIGSGTTAVVAQSAGRRWIGCDINAGSMRETTRRVIEVMQRQAASLDDSKSMPALGGFEPETVPPAQLAYTQWKINDYDLQIQHNEAVRLAAEHLGIERDLSDPFFEGRRGNELVRFIPFQHPLGIPDLEEIKAELNRRREPRDVLVVALDVERTAVTWIETHNTMRRGRGAANRIIPWALRTDPRAGRFIIQEPSEAEISWSRNGNNVVISVEEFVCPSIVNRLTNDGHIAAEISDWRQMVDSIAIDTKYNGTVFRLDMVDAPEDRKVLVGGTYEIETEKGSTVAIRIVDCLGGEFMNSFIP